MNTLTLLIGILLCVTLATARHFEDRDSIAEEEEQHDGNRHREHSVDRHRRRRWQMGYGYDYPPPLHGYYPERRDYDRNQQDYTKILKLLEEISENLRRPPPPPPQPIYIPYPVPYPVQYSPCAPADIKNVTIRFPEMEDTNQNWGLVPPKDDDEDEDGARPISFKPINPSRPMKRPAPKVEHGTRTDGNQLSTESPNLVDSPLSQSLCNAAILSCCANTKVDQKRCFINFGCGDSYDADSTCTNESISKAIDLFKNAYSPV